jgi:hypothetical protein
MVLRAYGAQESDCISPLRDIPGEGYRHPATDAFRISI